MGELGRTHFSWRKLEFFVELLQESKTAIFQVSESLVGVCQSIITHTVPPSPSDDPPLLMICSIQLYIHIFHRIQSSQSHQIFLPWLKRCAPISLLATPILSMSLLVICNVRIKFVPTELHTQHASKFHQVIGIG